MEYLTGLLENSTMPWLTAFILGLMTSISPCPLATNITAIGYISKDIENRNHVFFNGVFYTLGRAITYTVIPLIIWLGADKMQLSGFFQTNGEKFLGPLLILIGLFMLGIIKFSIPGVSLFAQKMEGRKTWNFLNVLFLGMAFALAFCPYSGVLFFGMLVPLTIAHPSGLVLPLFFALATGIPVIIASWFLAYTVSGIGSFYNKLKIFDRWFRMIIAGLFIGVGLWYIIRYLI